MCVQIDDQIERDFFPKHTYLITSFTLADENHVALQLVDYLVCLKQIRFKILVLAIVGTYILISISLTDVIKSIDIFHM